MCRQMVRKLTQQVKFSLVDQTKMITAASELSRNTRRLRRRRRDALGDRAAGHQDRPAPGVRGQGPRHSRRRPGADRRLDVRLAAWASGLSGSRAWSTTSTCARPSARAPASPSRAGNERVIPHLDIAGRRSSRQVGEARRAALRLATDHELDETARRARRDRRHRARQQPVAPRAEGRLLIGCRTTDDGLPARGDLHRQRPRHGRRRRAACATAIPAAARPAPASARCGGCRPTSRSSRRPARAR